MISVTKTTLPALEDYFRYLEEVWASGQLTNNGPLVGQLRNEIRKYLGISNLELLANGTLALQLAIKALDLKGEIITTPYSYVATTNAILWEGCTPVFVDIESRSFCINPDLIETAITEKTSAILATHVYGYPCDVAKIQKIADKHNLKVIYDAAHAFGVKLSGKSLLDYGDCSALSFHATKLFHTAEGGAVVSNNEDIRHRVFLMSKFGHIGEDEYLDIGINAKMSELHAAMGLAVLPLLDTIIAERKQCSSWYDEYLDGAELRYPTETPEVDYNYAYYPVVFPSHELMMKAREILHSHDIAPRRYFHPSLNTLPFLPPVLRRGCPVSERLAGKVLCLPLFCGLGRGSISNICRIIRNVLNGDI